MAWMLSNALMKAYASSPCSPAPAAESLAESCSAGELYAPSSATPTRPACSWRGKTTAVSIRFRSGMTFALSTGSRGEDALTSFLAAFPARTSAPPARAQESTASGLDCGEKCPASLAKYDRVLRSWKTRRDSSGEDSGECLAILPNWGTTRRGELFQRPTPSGLLAIRAWITSEKESGSLRSAPTPTATDGVRGVNLPDGRRGQTLLGFARNQDWLRLPTPTVRDRTRDRPGKQGGASLGVFVRSLATPQARDYRSGKASKATQEKNTRPLSEQVGGLLNPPWVEWLMGWPVEWTGCEPLATDKFRSWLRLHGEFLRVAMTKLKSHERI